MEAMALSEAGHESVLKLSALQRWRRGLRALLEVGKDPNRTDKVLEAYEHMNAGSEAARMERFYRLPHAQRLREEDRTLDSKTVDYPALLKLPPDTFGHQYARFMKEHQLTPDLFKAEGPLSQQAYMVKRLRQTHDLWHVVTGYQTDVIGELELQAFTFAQMKIPSALVLVFFGVVRWFLTGPELVVKVVRAFWRGRKARVLAATPWEELWSRPLEQVQEQLGVPPQPVEKRMRVI